MAILDRIQFCWDFFIKGDLVKRRHSGGVYSMCSSTREQIISFYELSHR